MKLKEQSIFEILKDGIDVFHFVTLEEVLKEFDLEEDRIAFLEFYNNSKNNKNNIQRDSQ